MTFSSYNVPTEVTNDASGMNNNQHVDQQNSTQTYRPRNCKHGTIIGLAVATLVGFTVVIVVIVLTVADDDNSGK